MSRIIDWQPLAADLAGEIRRKGFLGSDDLYEAFAGIPRHVFLPGFYDWEQPDRWITQDDDVWLTKVYSDTAWLTQYKPTKGDPLNPRWPTSSSTTPSLMADMITELGIEPGMRVLEVGTGTGYNAAILCHLLGDTNVTTIDIDPELVAAAAERLARLGYAPSFEPVDGAYDRVLVTHAVESIPHEWVRWAKPGGRILTDLRSQRMPELGVWATLTADPDGTTATGRMHPARGMFMNARTEPGYGVSGVDHNNLPIERLRKRTTTTPRTVLDDQAFAVFTWRHRSDVWWHSTDGHTNVRTAWGWADVNDDGTVTYLLLGDAWATIEHAHRIWEKAGRPGLGDWTLLATVDGRTVLAETDQLNDDWTSES